MRLLRQSTSVDVPIGPFVDQTDGFTAESALTLTQPDIRLKKNGGAWAQKNAAQTLTHEENGNYEVTLDATDTNTLGLLRLHVNESGALPVWEDFCVVTANFWDSLFSTDFLQVDVVSLANAVFTEAAIANDAIGKLRAVATGTADSGSTTTMVDAARTETGTDYWKGCIIVFGNTLTGQSRLITGFNPTTDTITFAPATTVPVTTGHTYEILPVARADVHLWAGDVANALIAGRVDANTQVIGSNAINAAAMNADMNSYTTRTWLAKQSTTADKYIVQWVKNGQILTSGITLPKIRVFDEDGTDLIAETAMTEIGATQSFKFEEATNKLTPGEIYMVEAKATIDGSIRLDRQPVMRDSA